MEQMENSDNKKKGFKRFAAKQVIAGVLIAVVGLWIFGMVLSFFSKRTVAETRVTTAETMEAVNAEVRNKTNEPAPPESPKTAEPEKKTVQAESQKIIVEKHAAAEPKVVTHIDSEASVPSIEPTGVAFVEAAIKPLSYELNDRFYGWRPNDIFDFTDNINHFQMGVLEVTRRTVEKLAENISRTGSTAAFDKNLEDARSTCFMVEAERYWFPSAEGKYQDGLKDLAAYAEKLKKGEAAFYTRADNLIPLLVEYDHLLGSCDDNLVKLKEEDRTSVSFFRADDYLYYAKGVASAMGTILKAIEKDFRKTLERRNCMNDIHHAVESCHHATQIDPMIVLNSDLSSIFANHRANMAANISHARFFIGVLIKTLST